MSLITTLTFILRHPLNRGHAAKALLRWMRWQLGSRLLPGPVAVPFVGSARLLVHRGMTGATGNLYCGLQEFEEMAFILHVLRPGDLFVDVGANIGSYSVLASGVAGARTVAFEPLPRTAAILRDHLSLNGLLDAVQIVQAAVGAAVGEVMITDNLDSMNHVLPTATESVSGTHRVPLITLDQALHGQNPVAMKLDTEGFERPALEGGLQVLRNASLLGLVVEMNGSGIRYGWSDEELHRLLLEEGFQWVRYAPFTRELHPQTLPSGTADNRIYVRGLETVRRRLIEAPGFQVLGRVV